MNSNVSIKLRTKSPCFSRSGPHSEWPWTPLKSFFCHDKQREQLIFLLCSRDKWSCRLRWQARVFWKRNTAPTMTLSSFRPQRSTCKSAGVCEQDSFYQRLFCFFRNHQPFVFWKKRDSVGNRPVQINPTEEEQDTLIIREIMSQTSLNATQLKIHKHSRNCRNRPILFFGQCSSKTASTVLKIIIIFTI